MTLIITSRANREFAEKVARDYSNPTFISPTRKRAVHGMDQVVIIGIHPHLERRYQGICPIKTIDPKPRPRKQTVTPNGS